jgi:hypothetical protein
MYGIIKHKISKLLWKFITFIEKIEFKDLNLDEDDISKKIIESLDINNISIKTDSGYHRASQIHITQPYYVYRIETHNGLFLECADNHIVFLEDLSQIFVKDLNYRDRIQTEFGLSEIVNIIKLDRKVSMIDITVDSPDHRFYSNGILSHNTVSSGIMILHFVLFNNNKNVLVTANKLDTAIEVLDKIRNIYELLPFFLQKGIVNWNQKFLVFENKSRIKGFATTKTASIGQTGDLLYLDEFAYLPDNIAEKFYKSVFPTIANIDNSKIIITSTPNGMNLFHKLLIDAEKPEGEKSSYVSKRVYWWQVPKRFVTYIRLYKDRMERHQLDEEIIFNKIKEDFSSGNPEMEWNEELKKWVINVYNSNELSEEDVLKFEIGGIKISQLADITTWKKETIKDIGGEESFNQEYDLRFINSSRSLLDESLIKELMDGESQFIFHEIDILTHKLRFSYHDLLWVDDLDIFDPLKKDTYNIFFTIDIAEGLGLDYSVINIFKMDLKDRDYILNRHKDFKNITDFINLKQIGIFRSNLITIENLAELFYLLAFEFFNEDKVKTVIEHNTYGGEFLSYLPHIFEGYNDFGNHVFVRFKHRIDAQDEKIGLKVNDNKNLLVKDYQDRLQERSITPLCQTTIKEMTSFIKQTTNMGNVKYAADGNANDDIVMTIVNLSQVFNKTFFKSLCEDYINEFGDNQLKEMISKVDRTVDMKVVESNNYSSIQDIRKKVLQSKRFNFNNR